MVGAHRRRLHRTAPCGVGCAVAVALCLLIVVVVAACAAAADGAVRDAATELAGNGSFEISVLIGGSEALEDLFEVCAHSSTDAVEQTVDKDGICGGREIVSIRPAEGEDSVFLALYKTSGGGQYGLAVSLLGACEAKLAPGARTVTVDFVVTADRVLHISTPGGLSGVNCRTELPLDSPALFVECQEPIAECERDLAARVDDMRALLGDAQVENDHLKAKHETSAAECEILAANLMQARVSKEMFAETLDMSQRQLRELKAAHSLLEEEYHTLEKSASAATAARDQVEAQLQVALVNQNDEMTLRKSAEMEAAELRQALLGTQAELESQFVALRSKLSDVTKELQDVVQQKDYVMGENRQLTVDNSHANSLVNELRHSTDQLSSDKDELETALAALQVEANHIQAELLTVSEERDALRSVATSHPHALMDVLMVHKEKLVLGAGTALAVVVGLTALIVRSQRPTTVATSNIETKQRTNPLPRNKGQKKKLERAEALAATHKKELLAAQSKIAELEGKELPELRHLLREAQHKFKREVEDACARQAADHEAAQSELGDEMERLKLELQDRSKELATAQVRLDELKSEHSSAEGSLEELRRVNQELQEASRCGIAEHAELRISGARAKTALTEAQARANVAEATSKHTSEELMESRELETDLATKLAEAENQLSVLQQASAASAAEHEKLQTAFVAAQQALVEARSDLHKTEAAHAASKAELEARVSNALSKSTADEAKSRVLRERIASVKQELALLRETAAETQVHEAATQDGAEFQDMPIELQTAFSELQEEKEVLEQRVAKVLSDAAEAERIAKQELGECEQKASSESAELRRKLSVCEAELARLQQVLKQPKNDNTGNVSLSPSDEDDDEEENGGDDAQVDLVKAPVFKVPQERLLRTPPSARNIPQGAKLTHHVDAKAVLSKNSGANLTHRDKLRRQSIQAHSTPARSVKPQTRHSTTTPQVPRSRRDSDAAVSTPRFDEGSITFGPSHAAPAWLGHSHSTATSPTTEATSGSSQLVDELSKEIVNDGAATVPANVRRIVPQRPRVKSLTVNPPSRVSGAKDQDAGSQDLDRNTDGSDNHAGEDEATTPQGGAKTPTFEDRLEAEADPSVTLKESSSGGLGAAETPPPTIAVRSPSRSKSPASSNSRRRSGSASRSNVTPSPGGSAGSSSKQRSRLARVKTGATPRQSPRPGVGFGSSSDRGLSPARRGSLSSSGTPGTPGTPGSVERRTPRLRYERKRRTPKLKYDSKSLNTHTHVDPNAVWQ